MTSTPDTRDPAEKAKARNEFLGRLSVYLVGVAIGFLLLGFFKSRSRAEARRREAERAALLGPRDASPSSESTSAPSPTPGPAPVPATAPGSSPGDR